MNDSEKPLFRGPRFAVHEIRTVLPDGTRHCKQVIRQPGAVVILPLLPDDRVLMIQNHRLTVGQTLLELPAGTMERDEPPEQTAARELVEETGYQAGQLQFVQSFFAAPGNCDEQMHLFVARNLRAGPPRREVGEQIDNLVTDWDQIRRWLADGSIRDAKTLIGLLLYLHRG